MVLERLSTHELTERCKEIFYDYLVGDNEKFYDGDTFIDCDLDYPTPLDMLYKSHIEAIEECRERIKFLTMEGFKQESRVLMKELTFLSNSNMEYQKELYEKTKRVEYSRDIVLIPLDKRINSFYDNLFLEVVFYDDVSTPKGQYSTYKAIEVKDVKKDFVKRNTEITHMSLIIMSNSHVVANISLLGEVNTSACSIHAITCLPNVWANFNNITLQDTLSLRNNDLRQWFQSKIDLDKEDLEIKSTQVIRGDEYRLYKAPNGVYFIRYVCPSTKRVYYNELVLAHLTLSNYFKEEHEDTYIKAWWNIVHLGSPVEGENWVRC